MPNAVFDVVFLELNPVIVLETQLNNILEHHFNTY